MQIGCCINLDPFLPQAQGDVKPPVTLETVANALTFLADTGFDFVECPVRFTTHPPGGDFRALVDVVRDSPIPAYAFNVFVPADMPLVGPARNMSRIRDHVAQACARLAELGGRVLVFGSGGARRAPDGYGKEAALLELEEFLECAAEAAAPYGITIMVEPLNKKETNTIHRVAEALALASAVSRPNVMGIADTYHMDMEGESAEALISCAAQLGHVHVADTGRLAPGTGRYDYAKLRKCLEQGGYNGAISIECRWSDFKAEAPHALSVLRRVWS